MTLKTYGARTLSGNWFEERIAIEEHYGSRDNPINVKDQTVDVHIRAYEESPKMTMNDAPVMNHA